MLSRQEYNLRKSALKRQYKDALMNVDISGLAGNPYVQMGMQKAAAKRALSGRGAYSWKDVGGSIGSYLGGQVGYAGLGNTLGRSAASGIMSHIVGRGAYVLKGQNHMQNMAFQGSEENMISELEPDVDGIHVIRSELVCDVTPKTDDEIETIFSGDINPLNNSMFPWLSQIAQYYMEYEFISCIFEYVSSVTGGDTTATGSVGLVGLTPDQADFQIYSQFDNFYSSVTGGVARDLLCGIECAPNKKAGSSLYPCKLPSGSDDPVNYNTGRVQIVTSKAAVNHPIGKIYVHYRVRLIKPTILSTNSASGFTVRQLNSGLRYDDTISGNNENLVLTVGNQSFTNILGSNITFGSTADISFAVQLGNQFDVGTLVTSSSYLGYANTSTPSAFSANATCVVLYPTQLQGLVGKQVEFCLNWFSGAFTKTTTANGSILSSRPSLKVGVISSNAVLTNGNAVTGASSTSDYYVTQETVLSNITSSAASTISYPDGLEWRFLFRIGITDDVNPVVVLMEMAMTGGACSTTYGNSLQITSLGDYGGNDYFM